jgi:hypothetical protein
MASMEEEGNDDCDTFNDKETMITIEIVQGVTIVSAVIVRSKAHFDRSRRYRYAAVSLIEKS